MTELKIYDTCIHLNGKVYVPKKDEEAWKLCEDNPPEITDNYLIKKIAYNTRGTIAYYKSGVWYVDGVEIKHELYKWQEIPR